MPPAKHYQNHLSARHTGEADTRCEVSVLTINFEILRKLPLKLEVEKGFPKLMPTVAYPLVTSNKMCQVVNQP